MGELIYKTNVHQDWISIFFFINLFLIVVLHYINPSRFIDIIKVFSSRVYFGKYAKDDTADENASCIRRGHCTDWLCCHIHGDFCTGWEHLSMVGYSKAAAQL